MKLSKYLDLRKRGVYAMIYFHPAAARKKRVIKKWIKRYGRGALAGDFFDWECETPEWQLVKPIPLSKIDRIYR